MPLEERLDAGGPSRVGPLPARRAWPSGGSAPPWSAWPCADLWNLFPASRRVNQHLKRDRLPSAAALAATRPGVLDWWRTAWTEDPVVGARFRREASAALPIGKATDLDDVFSGLEWRRLKLRQDQQVEEWVGLRRPA